VLGVIARREALQVELDQAVAAEDYERAAEIRDFLALLDGERRNGYV
jgi:protein-arginine kinase activator protein McsA